MDLADKGPDLAMRRTKRKGAGEMRRHIGGGAFAAIPFRSAPWRAQNPWWARPSAPVYAGGAVQHFHAQPPESSASAKCPDASAAAFAFNSALPANVVSVSSGSGGPRSPAPIGSMPYGPSSALISRTLPALWLATTKLAAAGQSYRASACFCSVTSSPMPLRARRSNSTNCSSLKGAPSAVPWISTSPPDAVGTKLASVSAVESSS